MNNTIIEQTYNLPAAVQKVYDSVNVSSDGVTDRQILVFTYLLLRYEEINDNITANWRANRPTSIYNGFPR